MLKNFNLLETLASLSLQVNERTGLSPSVPPPACVAWSTVQSPIRKWGLVTQYCAFSSWRKLFFISQKLLETIRG